MCWAGWLGVPWTYRAVQESAGGIARRRLGWPDPPRWRLPVPRDFLGMCGRDGGDADCHMCVGHRVPAQSETGQRRRHRGSARRYLVFYEMAAHRFTNLATMHLGVPPFMTVNRAGIIYKAYGEDG